MTDCTAPFTIAALRAELGLTLDRLALACGLSSKGRMSRIERGMEAVPLHVALKLEALSGGRLDAALLSPAVAAARQGCQTCGNPSTGAATAPAGKSGDSTVPVQGQEAAA